MCGRNISMRKSETSRKCLGKLTMLFFSLIQSSRYENFSSRIIPKFNAIKCPSLFTYMCKCNKLSSTFVNFKCFFFVCVCVLHHNAQRHRRFGCQFVCLWWMTFAPLNGDQNAMHQWSASANCRLKNLPFLAH